MPVFADQGRICLVGATGSGKSTTAELLAEYLAEAGRRSRLIALAAPLRDLQDQLYRTIGQPKAADQQDQQLMFALATNIRRIRPTALVEKFEAALADTPPDTVVINADLRDHAVDAVRLRELGFRFVRLRCDRVVRQHRLGRRDDISVVDDEREFRLDAIACDLEFDNSKPGLAHLRDFCRELSRDLIEVARCC